MKLARGIAAIPLVIILALLGIGAIGGTGYIAYEVGKSSTPQEETIVENEEVATTTETVATSTESEPEEESRSIIGSLQKQVADLTKKVSEPKVEEQKPQEEENVEPEPIVETVTASTNPAAQCLSTKASWDTFAVALNALDKQLTTVLGSYNDLAFGTENRPEGISARFAYNYTRMTSGKTSFASQVSKTREFINALPQAPRGTADDLTKMKNAYSNSLDYLETSYELSLQAFKVVGEDEDGYLSSSELNTSYSLFKDAVAEYEKISPELKKSDDLVAQFRFELSYGKVTGCEFTFYTDRTVATTIEAEELFTQQYPKSTATGEATLVSIKTTLPITISENGQNKTVLKLICNGDERVVSRVDSETVGTLLTKSYAPIRHQCRFTYTGNGNTLSTRTADFNW